MCGRFTLRTPASAVAEHFQLDPFADLPPRYNIAPTQQVAAVRAPREGGGTSPRELCTLRWGLIPSWAKDKKIGNRLLNARSDSVAEKPSFRTALRRRRCLVAADGFFEWQATVGKVKGGTAKQPFYITLKGNGLFAIAGLWERWSDPADEAGSLIDSCTLLTTEANAAMSALHDRMPVILSPAHYDLWLDRDVQTPEPLLPLLRPYDGELVLTPVSTWVNKPANEGEKCIEELA